MQRTFVAYDLNIYKGESAAVAKSLRSKAIQYCHHLSILHSNKIMEGGIKKVHHVLCLANHMYKHDLARVKDDACYI